jgi:hypothetical protein
MEFMVNGRRVGLIPEFSLENAMIAQDFEFTVDSSEGAHTWVSQASEENLLWTQSTSEGALANGNSGLNGRAD